jgi:phosphopantothenoylcysteine decarboxylase/phosphopantothenate--cysteine ligase
VDVVRAETARQMRDAVAMSVKGAAALIMAAAVADYTPASPAKSKIKKKDAAFIVDLKPTADILSTVQGGQVRVGFAAETENLIANARAKLQKKRLDLIVANDVSAKDAGFASDNNRVIIIDALGKQEPVALMPKYEVAQRILDRVAALLARGKK